MNPLAEPLFYAALVASYLLGSIPTGLWLGLRLKGVDIREHGSKNIGATNTLRILGPTFGVIALMADMLKGAAAVLLGGALSAWPHAPLFCGLAAIIGHSASIFIRFNGGKGVATSTGVFLALAPIPTLIAAGAFFLVAVPTRMVSAGSITAAITLAIAVFLFPVSPAVRGITVAVAAIVLVRHRSNIQRILAGTENRIGGKQGDSS